MKLICLDLPDARRRRAIEEAATQRQTLSVIVEKDFWVCWMLGILFESPFANDIVFKGGTSLSKVFGVIDRFSEDIDLSLSPEFLSLPAAGTTRNQANKWMEKAEAACSDAVRDRLQPVLEVAVAEVLGKTRGSWLEFQTDAITNSPVLLFHYPTTQPPGMDYLKRSVKLEFGSLTEQRPVAKHPVRPWLAEVFPAVFPDWNCQVVALEIERTFWEKVRAFLMSHQQQAAVHKLRTNQPLTADDLAELERILTEGVAAQREDLQRAAEEAEGLGLFLRSLAGLDRDAARDAFSQFLTGTTLSGSQIEILSMIIDHLAEHGLLDPETLYSSPFTDVTPLGPEGLFGSDQIDRLIEILAQVRQTAIAV